MTTYRVRDEYAPRFGRQVLTLWTGPFAVDYAGEAFELPHHDGYMVDLGHAGKVRVTCPSPRTDDNFQQVDDAVNKALEFLHRSERNETR